ncbi:MAG: hypothetical protein D3916_00345 [Candidatus Electrothrix sp. MAN1_4]|nr:hypothetical protein [Candidatus Electrothrix sp. MAN1_4]
MLTEESVFFQHPAFDNILVPIFNWTLFPVKKEKRMLQKKNMPEMYSKLGEIGFDKDEINTIQIVHELKNRSYSIDIKKLIHQVAFENLSKGIAKTFEKNQWSEEDFFAIVERIRDEKKWGGTMTSIIIF